MMIESASHKYSCAESCAGLMPLLSLYINNKAGGLIYHRVRVLTPSLPFLLARMPIGPPDLCPCHTGLCVSCSKD